MPDFRNEIAYADINEAYERSPVGKEALRLGAEAVDILVTLEVPSQTLWVPKSIGSHEVRNDRWRGDADRYTHHVMHYFNSGHAWQISEQVERRGKSTTVASKTAIDDQGRIFKRWVGKGAKDIVGHRRIDRELPIEGFVSPRYIDPSQAIEEIDSDEFQLGVFSLIGGYGIYRTIIDLSPAHHETPLKIPESVAKPRPPVEIADPTPKSDEPLEPSTPMSDILAILIRKQTEADDAKARAEARTLADLQSQIDQLTAKYQQIHASTLERMRHLPADDDRWQLLTLSDSTRLPAMLFCKKLHNDGESYEWEVPYYISYEGNIYYHKHTQAVIFDPMKPYGTVEIQYNIQTIIRSYTGELELLQKFHDSLPAVENPTSS